MIKIVVQQSASNIFIEWLPLVLQTLGTILLVYTALVSNRISKRNIEMQVENNKLTEEKIKNEKEILIHKMDSLLTKRFGAINTIIDVAQYRTSENDKERAHIEFLRLGVSMSKELINNIGNDNSHIDDLELQLQSCLSLIQYKELEAVIESTNSFIKYFNNVISNSNPMEWDEDKMYAFYKQFDDRSGFTRDIIIYEDKYKKWYEENLLYYVK